jgi:hypothetical protein
MNKSKQTKRLKRFLTMAGIVLITGASSQVYAQNGVGINPTGAAADPSAALDVSSTNKGVLVPRMTEAEKVAITSPANGLLIFQTDGVSGFWYYNATTSAWVQAVGPQGAAGANGQGGVTTAGSGINVTGAGTVGSPYVVSTTSPCGLAIGQTYQGGIIFYLDASGCHGLISAPTDQTDPITGIRWYNGSNTNTTAFASCAGCGDGNTKMIVYNQGNGSYAAKLCFDLELGAAYSEYKDWYLPSKYELNLMYRNIGEGAPAPNTNIGGFAFGLYWSSTENGSSLAWSQEFYSGLQLEDSKNATNYVRAIRAF